jgi:hypothetical protein
MALPHPLEGCPGDQKTGITVGFVAETADGNLEFLHLACPWQKPIPRHLMDQFP